MGWSGTSGSPFSPKIAGWPDVRTTGLPSTLVAICHSPSTFASAPGRPRQRVPSKIPTTGESAFGQCSRRNESRIGLESRLRNVSSDKDPIAAQPDIREPGELAGFGLESCSVTRLTNGHHGRCKDNGGQDDDAGVSHRVHECSLSHVISLRFTGHYSGLRTIPRPAFVCKGKWGFLARPNVSRLSGKMLAGALRFLLQLSHHATG